MRILGGKPRAPSKQTHFRCTRIPCIFVFDVLEISFRRPANASAFWEWKMGE